MANKIEGKKQKRITIRVYVSKEQKQIIEEKAKHHNLGASSFVRLLALNLPLPNFQKQKSINELLKINADLARLGNLLKLAIDEGTKSEEELNSLIEEIKETQDLLKEAIKNYV